MLVLQAAMTLSFAASAVVGNGLAASPLWWTAAVAAALVPLALWLRASVVATSRMLHPWLAFCALAMTLAGAFVITSAEMLHARLPSRGAPLFALLSILITALAHRLLKRTVEPVAWALVICCGVMLGCWLAVHWTEPIVPLLVLLAARFITVRAVATRERGIRHTYMLRAVTFREQQRHRLILENTFPKPVVRRLLAGEPFFRETLPDMTIMFADVKRFTVLSATMSPVKLLTLLNLLYRCADPAREWPQLAPRRSPAGSPPPAPGQRV